MTVLAFKENICVPLKKTIDQYKVASLGQFSSRDDLNKQWDRAEGLQMALNHIESVYAATLEAQPDVEILPPQ